MLPLPINTPPSGNVPLKPAAVDVSYVCHTLSLPGSKSGLVEGNTAISDGRAALPGIW